MALAFRPRIGPFIYIPNTGPGLVSKFIALLICLGLVWPVQLCWLAVKLLAQAVIELVRVVSYRVALAEQENKAKHRA